MHAGAAPSRGEAALETVEQMSLSKWRPPLHTLEVLALLRVRRAWRFAHRALPPTSRGTSRRGALGRERDVYGQGHLGEPGFAHGAALAAFCLLWDQLASALTK